MKVTGILIGIRLIKGQEDFDKNRTSEVYPNYTALMRTARILRRALET